MQWWKPLAYDERRVTPKHLQPPAGERQQKKDIMDTIDTKDTLNTTESALELPPLITPKRGFAALTAERRREIARQGGHTAHARGVAHEFTREEAREAGRKGGRTVSQDRHYMATIGRKGGLHSRKGRPARLG